MGNNIENMDCKICNNRTNKLTDAPIFSRKRMISYYKCDKCGFIQTQEPDWLEESYSSAITQSDIGLIARNIYNSNLTERILLHFYPDTGKCLDYGAGYGMFVRMMRDKGFDFYWHDDYCENIFATHFVGNLGEKYDLITAYEVFEHLPDPMKTVRMLASQAKNIIFSTMLTDNVQDFNNWWYRGEVSGQHISFYSAETLRFIASSLGMHYYSFENDTLHLFSGEKISEKRMNAFLHPRETSFFDRFRNREEEGPKPRGSLLAKDYENIVKEQLGK